jgi:hypothetical protein
MKLNEVRRGVCADLAKVLEVFVMFSVGKLSRWTNPASLGDTSHSDGCECFDLPEKPMAPN